MRNLLIEAQTGEPAPRQMHAQFFHQSPLAGDAVQIADQKNAAVAGCMEAPVQVRAPPEGLTDLRKQIGSTVSIALMLKRSGALYGNCSRTAAI
jgi:hypothetical protein